MVFYKCIFSSFVYDHQYITEIEQSHFFQFSLSSPALVILKSSTLTANNYSIARTGL